MTITQMECFVEAAKTRNLTRAAENLYISQQVMSRQIRALEKEIGFPVFERRNNGVLLTSGGEVLFAEWKELLKRYRSSVDRAYDTYQGERGLVRIGVSDMGSIVTKVARVLLDFNEKYPDLRVEYVVDSYPRMREEMETGRLHMLITFGVEILPQKEWHSISIAQSGFRAGIILSRHHPLARKREVTFADIQYETIGVLSDRLSVDHASRVRNEFVRHGVSHGLTIVEYDSFSSLQIAMATGKCVGVMYERLMDGMEDRLCFFPVDNQEHVGRDVVVAWINDRYAVKARNIAELLEDEIL